LGYSWGGVGELGAISSINCFRVWGTLREFNDGKRENLLDSEKKEEDKKASGGNVYCTRKEGTGARRETNG